MQDRFEIVYAQEIETYNSEDLPAFLGDYCGIKIIRDKLTGVLYLGTDDGMTLLVDENGKPLKEFSVEID